MSETKTIECSSRTAQLLNSVAEKRLELCEESGQLVSLEVTLDKGWWLEMSSEGESRKRRATTKVICTVDGSLSYLKEVKYS